MKMIVLLVGLAVIHTVNVRPSSWEAIRERGAP